MKKEWFYNYINNWTSEINWKNPDLNRIAGLLLEISKNNGGEIIIDLDLSDQEKIQFAVKKADEVLQKRVNEFAVSQKVDESFVYYGKKLKHSNSNNIEFAFPHTLVPKIELNSCSLEELEKLPGIGKVTGKLIIDKREMIGSFNDPEEVRKIKGISKDDYNKFKNMVYVRQMNAKQFFLFPELISFLKNPNFSRYVQLLITTKGIVGFNTNMDIKERIINELEDIKNLLIQNPFFVYKNIKQTRGSILIAQKELDKKIKEIEKNNVTDISNAGLIFDYQYQQVITEMIKSSRQLLYIIMFFFRFEDEKKYPTDELVSEIIKAKKRNVSIKIILDLDRKIDPYRSKEINIGVYKYLKKNRINVVFDAPEKLTHSKLFISDGRHVIIGSHNLTAGSFYVYDDTSIYIDSEDYASQRILQFNELWKENKLIEKYSAFNLRKIIVNKYLRRQLDQLRITNSIGYLLKAKIPTQRRKLSKMVNIDEKVISKIANICDLLRLSDITIEYAKMLEEIGIDTIPEMSQRNAGNLLRSLKQYQSEQSEISTIPDLATLSSWIEQSKKMERIIEY